MNMVLIHIFGILIPFAYVVGIGIILTLSKSVSIHIIIERYTAFVGNDSCCFILGIVLYFGIAVSIHISI